MVPLVDGAEYMGYLGVVIFFGLTDRGE